jgi:hypothetical protein
MAEAPPTHEVLPVLQEFLREAIQLSCGDTVDTIIDDYPVAYGNAWKSNGDFQCFVAAAIFSRTIGMQNKFLAALRTQPETSNTGEMEASKPKTVCYCIVI